MTRDEIISKIGDVATVLNEKADIATSEIARVEEILNTFGVGMDVRIDGDIGFFKVDGSWGIGCLVGDGECLARNAPRGHRIRIEEHLDELLGAMLSELESVVSVSNRQENESNSID